MSGIFSIIWPKVKFVLTSKTIRDGAFFSIFSFFNKGVGFVLMIILADYINPSQYGELSLFSTLCMFVGYIIAFSTTGYLGISYFKNSREQFKRDVTSIMIIAFSVFVFLLLLFASLSCYISEALKVSTSFLFIGISICLASVFNQLNLDYCRVREKVLVYGILSCSYTILNFILSLYFVTQLDLNWHGRVFAQLSVEILFALVALISFIKDDLLSLPNSLIEVKSIIVWGIPLIPHYASNWVKQGLDRYIIEGSHSMSDVGLFSFAMNVSTVIVMVGIAFNQVNCVKLYQILSAIDVSRDQLCKLRRQEFCVIGLYFIISVLFISLGGLFVKHFIPNYSDSIPYFILLSIYAFFSCVYFLFVNYLFYFGRNKEIMFVTFGSSLIHLVFSWTFTKYNLLYTCWIYVASQILVCILIYYRSRICVMKNILNN